MEGQRIDLTNRAAWLAAGIGNVIVVDLEPDDLSKDEAGQRLAQAVAVMHLRVDPALIGRSIRHGDAFVVKAEDR